ncbi:MAG: hypothetical protein HY698_16850 [Deltaproteobacteria bacterium]|nr:hypothetical protein [Deltaproteobacteria bacterium]
MKVRDRAALLLHIACAGCAVGSTSLERAERKGDAAFVGTRLEHPREGSLAAERLVAMASRGHVEAQAVLKNRLAVLPKGAVQGRLDDQVASALARREPGIVDLVAQMAQDERVPFRQASLRFAR